MRNMDAVVEAMCNELTKVAGPIHVLVPLSRLLKHIAEKQGLTAPEALPDLWRELTLAFNRAAFGTEDQLQWVRANAPPWALKAGAILAGEVRVEGQ